MVIDADGARVGSEGSLSLLGDVDEMLAFAIGEDDGLVLEWGGVASASAGGEDPTA